MPEAAMTHIQKTAPLDAGWRHSLQQEISQDRSAFNTAILNSLAAEIAVIDLNGVIREVNEPWRRFAIANGHGPSIPAPHTDVGTNYLAICEATSASAEGLSPSYAGTLAVLHGDLPPVHIGVSLPLTDRTALVCDVRATAGRH